MDISGIFTEAERLALLAGATALKGLWKPTWRPIALETYNLEKAFKEGRGPNWEKGHMRKAAVLELLHERFDATLAPLPDFAEDLFWLAISKGLDAHITELDRQLSKDWVSVIEDAESHTAWPLETIFHVDLDEDGVIGRPIAAALVLLASLLLAGDARAIGRPHLHEHYGAERAVLQEDEGETATHEEILGEVAPRTRPALVEHYRSGEAAEIRTAPEPSGDGSHLEVIPASSSGGPARYPHYQPSPEYLAARAEADQAAAERRADGPIVDGWGLETWAGHSPARGGIDTGVGLTVRRGSISVGAQLAADRLGVCLGVGRLGANYLWDPRDGSLELGGYVVPFRF